MTVMEDGKADSRSPQVHYITVVDWGGERARPLLGNTTPVLCSSISGLKISICLRPVRHNYGAYMGNVGDATGYELAPCEQYARQRRAKVL